jgi:hypothetical protein
MPALHPRARIPLRAMLAEDARPRRSNGRRGLAMGQGPANDSRIAHLLPAKLTALIRERCDHMSAKLDT